MNTSSRWKAWASWSIGWSRHNHDGYLSSHWRHGLYWRLALYYLERAGKRAVNFDQSADRHRIDWLMSAEEQAAITFVQGDLRDSAAVKAVFRQHQISHVIHLAALQVPMCRDNPVLGAQVNVDGHGQCF